MKKIMRFLMISSVAVLINTGASHAASISFTPSGRQVDADPILDIVVRPGQILDFTVLFDTNNIVTNPPLPFSVDINFSIQLDTTELILVNLPGGTTATGNGFRSNPNAFTVPQNRNGTLTTFQVRALDGLKNDGHPDVSLLLNQAIVGGAAGQDVTNSFGGAGVKQTVSVQAPETYSALSLLIFGVLGASSLLKRKYSEQK